MGCKKQGAKKQGHCYSKREEARLPLLIDPVFKPNFFQVHILDQIFLKFQTLKNIRST